MEKVGWIVSFHLLYYMEEMRKNKEPQNLSSETNKEYRILPDQVLSFLCSLLFLFSTLFLMACLCEAMTTNVFISYLKSFVVQQSM